MDSDLHPGSECREVTPTFSPARSEKQICLAALDYQAAESLTDTTLIKRHIFLSDFSAFHEAII